MTNALAREVERRMERLAAAAVEGLYADPFWFARYGEARARRYGGEDSVFHVRYLIQALDANDVRILERYTRWLQTLLVTRGMCSRHIDANYQGLCAALIQEGFGESSQALLYLAAARAALDWPEGPAHEIHEALPRLLAQTLGMLSPSAEGPLPGLEDELRLHFSYLMDALGTQRPQLFVDHVRWYAGFWPHRGLRLDFRELLESMRTALLQLPPASQEALATVTQGLTALEKD
jgi:hypothetical protein